MRWLGERQGVLTGIGKQAALKKRPPVFYAMVRGRRIRVLDKVSNKAVLQKCR
jgi:hypothetical protein